ncbi:MAG: Hsp20/alpha crystallin family protein [Candidatus Omnitrophica bacterium]|nr:Hsp20/alpha crystallin family protein [Candidatus Omnitrophota bacterium]
MSFSPQNQTVVWKNPFFEMEKLHRDLNHFFEGSLPGKGGAESSLLAGCWSPAVDVVDTKEKVIVKVDLPGLKKEDIDVSIENGVLTIRGEKKQEIEHKNGDVLRSERYYGSFYRAFTLPSSVDAGKVNARFEDGVLELSVLKKEESKPRQIKIDVK